MAGEGGLFEAFGLSDDILHEILQRLAKDTDLKAARLVCRRWRHAGSTQVHRIRYRAGAGTQWCASASIKVIDLRNCGSAELVGEIVGAIGAMAKEVPGLRQLAVAKLWDGQAVAALTQLEELQLIECGRGAAAAAASMLPGLKTVKVRGTKLLPQDVAALAAVKSVTELRLQQVAMEEEGMRALGCAAGKQLQVLDVGFNPLGDKGVAAGVARLKQLRELNMQRTFISDAGLQQLGALQQLTQLGLLGNPRICGQGLAYVPGGVRALDLRSTSVCAEALHHLQHLAELSLLKLSLLPAARPLDDQLPGTAARRLQLQLQGFPSLRRLVLESGHVRLEALTEATLSLRQLRCLHLQGCGAAPPPGMLKKARAAAPHLQQLTWQALPAAAGPSPGRSATSASARRPT